MLQVNLCQKLLFLQNMGRTCCVHKLFWMLKSISVHNMFWACNSMNNMSSYCGLVDAKIRASDKDLPLSLCSFCLSKVTIKLFYRSQGQGYYLNYCNLNVLTSVEWPIFQGVIASIIRSHDGRIGCMWHFLSKSCNVQGRRKVWKSGVPVLFGGHNLPLPLGWDSLISP